MSADERHEHHSYLLNRLGWSVAWRAIFGRRWRPTKRKQVHSFTLLHLFAFLIEWLVVAPLYLVAWFCLALVVVAWQAAKLLWRGVEHMRERSA